MAYVSKIDLAKQAKLYSGDTATLSGSTYIIGGITGGTDSVFYGTVQGYDAIANNEFVTYQQAIRLSPKAGQGIIVATGNTGSTISVYNGQGLTFDNSELTLDLVTKTLVNPLISPTWTCYQADGVTGYNIQGGSNISNNKFIVVDIGCKINLNAYYTYPNIPDTTYALPTNVVGSFGSNLPLPNVNSDSLNVSGITSDSSYYTTLQKSKSGLVVVNSQVQFPSGYDATSDSIGINFQSRSVLIKSTSASLTDVQIESVLNNAPFTTTKVETFYNVTANAGEYLYYILYNQLGRPTNVIQDGALPVFAAFQFLTNVNIINSAGYTISVILMRSNATNAFNNNTLAFL